MVLEYTTVRHGAPSEIYYGGSSLSRNQLALLRIDCTFRHCQLNGRNLFGGPLFGAFLLLLWGNAVR